jgi:hypothetical protein
MSVKGKLTNDLPGSHDHVIEQLLGKPWGELEILEYSGRMLFPAEIHKITKGGTFETVLVRLMIPREPELRKARVKARELALKSGIDLDRDKDLFNDLETICILAVAIRNYKPMDSGFCEPFEMEPEDLEKLYDRASLMAIYEKLERLSEVINPQPNKTTKEETLALMAAIAKERNISPLAVFGPDAQNSFIVTMVDLLLSYMRSKSSSEPSEPSIQA